MSGTQQTSAPRVQAVINGVVLPILSADVNSNGYYHADNFKIELLATDPRLSNAGFGAVFWCNDTTGASSNPVTVEVQIDIGLTPRPNWTTVIAGRVDSVEYDPITGLVELEGRDNTALFIETRTFQTYKNQTSSQIATILAQQQGLTANVAATTTLVDRYYSADHDKMTLNDFTRVTNEWDLLTFLAQEEGYSVWVSGNTLNFQPVAPPTQNPVVVTLTGGQDPWVTSNAATVRLRRALTLARDIQVTVQSWSSRSASSFKVTAKATGAKKASSSATAGAGQTTTQNYVYTRPNLTHAQAQALANQKLAELSAHERVVTITMAGETSMTPRQGLQITGTGTNFDLAYYITEINRHIDADGFHQTVTAKNSSPKDTSVVG